MVLSASVSKPISYETIDDPFEKQILATAMDAADYEVRVTVLGVAGIVVDNSKLHAEKTPRKKSPKKTAFKPMTEMSAVVALSRDNQQTAISSMSKAFMKADEDSTADRYVAVWPYQNKAEEGFTADPTFKFETRLRSIDCLSHLDITSSTAPKVRQEIDLILALSEGSHGSQIAIPIAVSSLSVTSELSRHGQYVLDLPLCSIRNKSEQEPLRLYKDELEGQSGISGKKKGLFSRKRKTEMCGSKSLSSDLVKQFSGKYQADPSGDSVLRVQVEVLHRISSETKPAETLSTLSPMDGKQNIVGKRKHSFTSITTPVHQNIRKNDERSSPSNEAGAEAITSVEVTTEAAFDGNHQQYIDVVRIDPSHGQEALIFSSEESSYANNSSKPYSVKALDSLLPSVCTTDEIRIELPLSFEHRRNESKHDDASNSGLSLMSRPHLVSAYSEDLTTDGHNFNKNSVVYGCNAMSDIVETALHQKMYGEDDTLGYEDGTYYTNLGGEMTLGNNTYDTVGSIDFWSMDTWCTAGKELLEGDVPNVYDENTTVAGTHRDEELTRRALGWKRHLQRIKEEEALSRRTSTAISYGDTNTLMDQSTAVESFADLQIRIKKKGMTVAKYNSQNEEGLSAHSDTMGATQKKEVLNELPPSKHNYLSKKFQGLFSCHDVFNLKKQDTERGIPKVVGNLRWANSGAEMTAMTHDIAFKKYDSQKVLSSTANLPITKGGNMVPNCFCTSYHDDLVSLAAKTDDGNEDYFKEYDEYSFLAVPVTADGTPSKAEI